jgi:RNA recognition motif-containing protein
MVLYVGNLPFNITEQEINTYFTQYGEVQSVKLIADRETGRKKGYGFIEMGDEDAQKVLDNLSNLIINGRNLKVNEAKQREERPPRGNNRY